TATREQQKAPAAAEEKLYRVALREALTEEMDRDDTVYLIGEDIGKFGGAYRVTEGLLDRFGPQRVVDAPIAEEVIVGTAIGSAMLGLRPVVEMMTINFSVAAYDQVVNNAAKSRYMFGREVKVPKVRGMVPASDYTTPLGKAALRREGSDVTVVGVSRMAVLANEAAKQLEEDDIDAEVIDLRSVRPIDWQPIVDSVRKTSRCVVVEEGWSTYGVTAEVVAGVQERCFDYLDAPVRRLGGAQVPMPYNQGLERASIPTAEDIKRLVRATLGKKVD